MINPWLQVAAGGALGAMGRFGIGRLYGWSGQGWPLHTLGVNVLGGLMIGVLVGLGIARGWDVANPFLIVGLLGGFTTFSSFSLEVWQLFERGHSGTALGYVLASVALSVAGVGLGLALARLILNAMEGGV